MDILESSSDSDVDTELQDLEQINAVLEADERTCSTIISSLQTPIASSLVSRTPNASTSKREHTKIDEALALNRLMDEKYQKLETLLLTRLQECEEKLKEIENPDFSRDRDVVGFRYFQCGRPYFKDKHNFTSPPNDDTILMERTQMYDFTTLITIPGWTVNDKTSFTNLMLTMSQEVKVKDLLAKIAQLKRESNKSGKSRDKEIRAFNKEIINVKTKPLEQVALPLDREYDWETLANKLNHRHSAQEYRAFWKLFFHPSVNKSPWSKAEHRKLQEIASNNNYEDWDTIAKTLDTRRTGYQCFVYFRTNMSTTTNGKKWTKEEVEYLKRLIDYYKEDDYIPWTRVASAMENRTRIQIYNKYVRMQEDRKGRFLPEEDSVILNCYERFGNDFKKISEFLPGRSQVQIRVRYNILSKKNISVVWTVEEDRKLLQMISNEGSETFYSNATKHFPGKSRINIRTRYITLVNWMRRHPHWDIEYAPRRGARRLPHGSPNDNISKAIENLEQRIKTEVNVKKSSKITKDSPENQIEHAIIAVLMTELSEEEDVLQQENYEGPTNETPSSSSSAESDMSLKHILLLLNSKLNPTLFQESPYVQQHETLKSEKVYTSEKLNYVVKVKSYSKKEPTQTVVKNLPDIWGNNLVGTLSYVFPPHYATITGCKALMSVISDTDEPDGCISLWMRRNEILRNQMTLLMERFCALFTWPMMLSNVEPNIKKITTPIETPIIVRKKRSSSLDLSSVIIPQVKKRFLNKQTPQDDENESIDLPTTEVEKDNVTVVQDFDLLQDNVKLYENMNI